MKIALFCDTYIPVKNWLVSMVSQIKSSLESAGHEVYLFCPDYPDHIDTEKNIIRIRSVWTPLKLDDRLPITLKKRKEIKQFLIDNTIDIVHSHSEFVLGRLSKKLAKQCNIKFIHTFHTMWEDYSHYVMVPKLSIRKAIQIFLKDVEHISTPSIKSLNYLEKILKRDDIKHIPNFIDETKLKLDVKKQDIEKIKSTYHIWKQDVVVTFIWRVSSEKRVFEMVESYDTHIFPKNTHIKLMIVWDGKDFKKIQKYVEKSAYKENYILTWYVPWNTINQYYSISDIYTTMSVSETHPMTVTEAVYFGLPCVVTEDESFSGLVMDTINWYVSEDTASYSKHILNLAQDEKTREIFREKNKEVADKYVSENIINEYLKFYQI